MSGTAPAPILFFLEDPGAVTFALPLLDELIDDGRFVLLYSAGTARDILNAQNRKFLVLDAEDAGAVLEETLPSVVLTGTSENLRSAGLALIAEGRARGIPTIGLVDARMSSAQRFRGESDQPLTFAPDFLIVPDEFTRSEFARIGFPANQIELCVHPAMARLSGMVSTSETERAALRNSLFPSLPREKQLLLLLTEISTGLDPAIADVSRFSLKGSGRTQDRTKIVLEELRGALGRAGIPHHLVLKLHPKESEADYCDVSDLFEEAAGGQRDKVALLKAADLVVGLTTTLLAEAHAMGLPTLSIVTRPEERKWLKETDEGLIPCAATRAELEGRLADWKAGRLVGIRAFDHGSKPPQFRLSALVDRILADHSSP